MEQLIAACPACKEVAVEIVAQGSWWKEVQCGACAKLWFISHADKAGD